MTATADRRCPRLSPAILRVIGIILVTSLTGCVSSDKYRRADDEVPPAKLLNVPFPAAYPPTSLTAVVIYRGAGSWKREALWDEYMVTVRNPGEQPLIITSATLIDFAGVERPAAANPWALEELSKQLFREYDRAGVAFAKEGASAVMYVGGIAAGAEIFAASASTSGVVVTPLQGPIALVTVPTYIVARTIANHDAREDIESEFNQRRFPLPTKLAPGQTRLGCFFFPMVPNPRALRFHWRRGEEEGDAELSLEFLKGLHTPVSSDHR